MARTDSLTTFAQISFGAFAIALIISDLRKWFPLAWTAFTTIVFALISISWVGLQDHAADPWMIANLAYASGFLMFLHWIRSQPKTEFEGGVLVLLVTLLLSHVTSGSTGVAASLLFTIATAGAAWLIAKPQDKGAALAQPAAGFLLLGPLHWRGDPLGPICTLIALALAAMTARRPREWMLLLAVFNGSLGAAWLLKLDELQGVLWAKVPQAWLWWIALWATTLLLAAPFRTCWAKHKEVIYVLVLGPANFATWEAALFLLLRSLGLDHAAASSGGIALYGLGYMTAGSLAKIGEMRVAGLLAILVCTAKLFLVDLTILPLGTRVALFILFGLAVLAASYFFYVKRQKDQEPSAL